MSQVQQRREERKAEIRSKASPVQIPKCEFIEGVTMSHSKGKSEYRMSIQYHGSDAQIYELRMDSAEALALSFQLLSLLKILDDSAEVDQESIQDMKKYLFETYLLKLPISSWALLFSE